jgi:hypothetical protein
MRRKKDKTKEKLIQELKKEILNGLDEYIFRIQKVGGKRDHSGMEEIGSIIKRSLTLCLMEAILVNCKEKLSKLKV